MLRRTAVQCMLFIHACAHPSCRHFQGHFSIFPLCSCYVSRRSQVANGIHYFESGDNVTNEYVQNNRTFRVVEPSFGIRPDYDPVDPPEGDGPYGPVDSDDRYAPPEEYSDLVTDLRDEHNQPGSEMPGTGSHYDEVFDDGATDPKPMTRR